MKKKQKIGIGFHILGAILMAVGAGQALTNYDIWNISTEFYIYIGILVLGMCFYLGGVGITPKTVKNILVEEANE